MARFLNLLPWRRRRLEQDLDRELRDHLDRRVADLTRSGMSDHEARRQAALEFGGFVQVQEEVRETWVWRWLDQWRRDVRYAARTLRRGPAFTAAAVVSLALGIGANAAIFSLVDQTLLRTLPVTRPDRLVQLGWHGNSLSSAWGTGWLLSYPLCRELQEQDRFFDGVICRHPTAVYLSIGQQHDQVRAEIVSGSYFSVLGVRPEQGRLIDPSDDRQPGAHPVVVLSYTYWQRALAGAHDVVGRAVLVNNAPMTVIGVAPPRFTGLDPLDAPSLWIPAMMKKQATPEWDRLFDRRAVWMHGFARLKPGVTAAQAREGLQPWFASMLDADTGREGFPKVTADQHRSFLASTLDLEPAPGGLDTLQAAVKQPLLVLMGGTLLLVLLATLNVAGLLLARGAARVREVTTRMALGASRGRVTSQLLTEGVVVALMGGALGLLVTPLITRVLLLFLPEGAELTAGLDARVFLFATVISLATGALCGLAPAWQARRGALTSSARSQVSVRGAVRLRKAIVVTQMAFALVLLIGAGLFVQTLARLYGRDLGFASDRLLMFRVEPDAIGHPPGEAAEVMRTLVRRLQAVPGVEGAAVANSSLLTGGSPRRTLTIQAETRVVTERSVPIMRVGPGFFAAIGTPLVAGREFTADDARDIETRGYRAVIVNERFARRYFGGTSPVGRLVGVGNQPNTPTTIEIVGVVRDFNFRFVRDDMEPEHVFFPFAETGPLAGNGTIYLKVTGAPESAAAAIQAAAAEVDPRLPLLSLRTVGEQIDRVLRSERMLATLSSGFGAAALVLAVVGLYGVMSFVVTRRTQEIGLRLALGATRANAIWLIARDAMVMIVLGMAIAIPAAGALRRLVEAQLFGIPAFDGPTIALAAGLLALVALAAAMLPAWRAASISPTDALRLE